MGSLADFAPQNRQETTGKFEQQGKREHFSLITTIINNDCKGLPKLAPKLGSQLAPVWVTGASSHRVFVGRTLLAERDHKSRLPSTMRATSIPSRNRRKNTTYRPMLYERHPATPNPTLTSPISGFSASIWHVERTFINHSLAAFGLSRAM